MGWWGSQNLPPANLHNSIFLFTCTSVAKNEETNLTLMKSVLPHTYNEWGKSIDKREVMCMKAVSHF